MHSYHPVGSIGRNIMTTGYLHSIDIVVLQCAVFTVCLINMFTNQTRTIQMLPVGVYLFSPSSPGKTPNKYLLPVNKSPITILTPLISPIPTLITNVDEVVSDHMDGQLSKSGIRILEVIKDSRDSFKSLKPRSPPMNS